MDFLAPDKKAPDMIDKFRAWWDENRNRTRQEWVLSGFRAAGYAIERLDDKAAIPVLLRAIEDKRHAVRFNALRVLMRLTGESFGWKEIMDTANFPRSVFERSVSIKAWKQWWDKQNSDRK